MSDKYGITHDGYEFKVSQIAGVTVGRYKDSTGKHNKTSKLASKMI
jgi:hypothetical protein